ncbi:MAG: glutaredoxin domain-containing protein [Dehalococcoidia bacterium]|jgi:glutaredoxin|nr:glutaredoxin domain-containing protein [Dehalococcoidia bacterium]
MTAQTPLRVLSTDWCAYCRVLKHFLDEHAIPYDQLNVDEDDDALAEIQKLQNGGRTVPTVIYADGTHDVNPSGTRLMEKLGAST